MKKYWLTIIVIFIIDRLTKIYFLKNSSQFTSGGFFNLYLNQDIAFSLPVAVFILLPLIILILIGLIFAWWKYFKKQHIFYWPISFIIIGAISNLLDRVRYGAVIDFIDVPYFTVLNLSDIYISTGVIWILCFEFISRRRQKIS